MIIGITGKAGCGKSTIAKALKERGLEVIYLDKLGHEALEEEREKLKKIFGKEIISKKRVNRSALAKIVFSDPGKLTELNGIIHPLIKKKAIDILSKSRRHVVIDGALLHQIGLDSYCDLVIFVDCPEEIALKRLVDRGVDKKRAISILKAQRSLTNCIKRSDYLITNDKSPTELIKRVLEILSANSVVI
ncbi:hypothetical protein AT15_06645 [Kosmotoga arenicorallina S304]|uniref:Dephospho-CoA kinase n=1 Tax=Kosmotoga arenicorallina S304 TaxID=1453497 RepID=A0A176K1T9_9BACT|nr:dephospho-CoA kinase [Kosmotoga arenicorallina]OAA31170.1 hypothetical protein AT15_06645 [Kosmotoga arenicorallina S304]